MLASGGATGASWFSFGDLVFGYYETPCDGGYGSSQ